MAKILICDDSSFLRKIIKNIVTEEGHIFIEAKDGEELLDITKNDKFDCILLDLLMPKKNGFEVLEELKSRGNTTPIIVISADIQESSKKKCFALGAIEFLNKPPRKEDLVNAINNALD